MKTKNKLAALVQITIVLCSMFLVAIPAIAADENVQKGSANEVTTASEDDYVLGVYGNANEDDTIDMGDVVYTKLAIFGKKPKTELCDAKYDGRINVLDVIQTKLIILGKEKELTIEELDVFTPQHPVKSVVTVLKPVERIVVLMAPSAETLRAINAADKIVGVGTQINDKEVFFPELSKLPCIGTWMGSGLDYEAILNLNPDLFMTFVKSPRYMDEKKLPGVTVIDMGLYNPAIFPEGVRKLGYILDKRDEAEKYLNWHEGGINEIKSKTDGLSVDEKPSVFLWAFFTPGSAYTTVSKSMRHHQMCDAAGGKDIAGDLSHTGPWPKVDAEWVIEQNPDIIIALTFGGGYGVDDPSEMAAAKEDILKRPELAKVTAVKTGNVYIMNHIDIAAAGGGCLIGTAYMAKWLQPELFEDLVPRAIHQEHLTRFQGLDYDLDNKGVFVYPEPS